MPRGGQRPYRVGHPSAEAGQAPVDHHDWLNHGFLEVADLKVGRLLYREDEEQPKASHHELCGSRRQTKEHKL